MQRPSPSPAADAPGLPRADWDDLFRAVCDRLRSSVAPTELPRDLRHRVLDCVAALEQLHLQLGAAPDPQRADDVPGRGHDAPARGPG